MLSIWGNCSFSFPLLSPLLFSSQSTIPAIVNKRRLKHVPRGSATAQSGPRNAIVQRRGQSAGTRPNSWVPCGSRRPRRGLIMGGLPLAWTLLAAGAVDDVELAWSRSDRLPQPEGIQASFLILLLRFACCRPARRDLLRRPLLPWPFPCVEASISARGGGAAGPGRILFFLCPVLG